MACGAMGTPTKNLASLQLDLLLYDLKAGTGESWEVIGDHIFVSLYVRVVYNCKLTRVGTTCFWKLQLNLGFE